MNRELVSYEESVNWMRNQPGQEEFVKLCYLDEDNLVAAKRFEASEEFSEIVTLLRLNSSPKPKNILDLGCGNGIVSYAFAALGHHIFAVDPDLSGDVGLEAAKRLSSTIESGSIETFQAFAESLPFSDSTFDVVYERQALHHFSDLQRGLSECFRVLKPEGLLLATREHVIDDETQLQEFFDHHILHQLHGGENAYPVDTYLAAIAQAGFKEIRTIAPFENAINHFPTSNAEVQNQIVERMQQKVGSTIAGRLVQIPQIEMFYRKRLSQSCTAPGRLYSFLAKK